MSAFPPILKHLPALWFNSTFAALTVYYFDLPLEILLFFFLYEITVLFIFVSLQLALRKPSSYILFLSLNTICIVSLISACLYFLPAVITGFQTGISFQAAALLTPLGTTLVAHMWLVRSQRLSNKFNGQHAFSTEALYVFAVLSSAIALPVICYELITQPYSLEFKVSTFLFIKYFIDVLLFKLFQ